VSPKNKLPLAAVARHAFAAIERRCGEHGTTGAGEFAHTKGEMDVAGPCEADAVASALQNGIRLQRALRFELGLLSARQPRSRAATATAAAAADVFLLRRRRSAAIPGVPKVLALDCEMCVSQDPVSLSIAAHARKSVCVCDTAAEAAAAAAAAYTALRVIRLVAKRMRRNSCVCPLSAATLENRLSSTHS
jgi:hypothetical protein